MTTARYAGRGVRAVRYTGTDGRVASTNRLILRGSRREVGEPRTCQVCGLDVPTKTNGDLRTHRVGPSMKLSWLCPGEDRGME